MVNRLIALAQSKWIFGVICAAWAAALGFVVARGWVWENGDTPSGHGFEIRSDFFEIHRTRELVWLSLILASYGAFYLKKRSIRAFGCLEISAGILAGYFDVSTVPFNQIDAWIALVLAAYAVVSGAENIFEGS